MEEGSLKAQRHNLGRKEAGKRTPGKDQVRWRQGGRGKYGRCGGNKPRSPETGQPLNLDVKARANTLHNSGMRDSPHMQTWSQTRQGEFAEQEGWEEALSVI